MAMRGGFRPRCARVAIKRPLQAAYRPIGFIRAPLTFPRLMRDKIACAAAPC